MKRCRLPVLVPIFLALSLSAAPAQAISTDGAVAHVRSLAQQALVTLRQADLTLEQREEALRPLLLAGFDVPSIGRFALGRGWSQASPQQQADYVDLFGELIVKTTAKRLGGFVGERFEVTGVRAAGERDILVITRVQRPDSSSVGAVWRVRQVADYPKIVDVSVGGLSLAKARRGEFKSVTRNQGIEGLLQVLRARVGRLTAAAN